MDPVLLIGVKKPNETAWKVDDYLDELQMLASNVGLKGRFRLVQKRTKPDNTTFVGSGMLERIHQTVVNEDLKAVIFDDELTPAQQRNIEAALPVPVFDRTFVILSIFSERAKTKEARTQVELARLKYEYPRLKKMWTHLSRQVGGIGARGEGEKQLEVDRRIARKRIGKLERALKRFESGRNLRKKQRRNLVNIALVGYTNVGKSTLMNQLTKAQLEADDRLFVTLDATSRLWTVDPVLKIVLTDTVGFVRKLPHDLVASFRSTLSEVRHADLLFHVVEASHPHLEEMMETVNDVLESLVDTPVPRVLVFNKIDVLSELDLKSLKREYPDALFLSAIQREGLDQVQFYVLEHFSGLIRIGNYHLPNEYVSEFYRLGEYGQILHSHHDEDGIHIQIRGFNERLDALERNCPFLGQEEMATSGQAGRG